MWISCDELFKTTPFMCKFLFAVREGYIYSDSNTVIVFSLFSWEINPSLRRVVAKNYPEALI